MWLRSLGRGAAGTLLALAVTYSGHALGAGPPTRFSRCPSIGSPPESGGHHFSEDCQTVYILPPARAVVRLTGVAGGRDRNFCSTVDGAVNVFAASARALSQAAEAAVGGAPAGAAPGDCANASSDLAIVSAYRAALQSQVADAVAQVSAIEARLAACTQNCQTDRIILNTKRAELEDLKLREGRVGVLATLLSQTASNCRQSNPQNTGGASDPARFQALQQQSLGVGDQLLTLLGRFGQVEGATVSLLFETNWNQLITEYRRLNPGLSIEQMPTDMALTFSTAVSGGSALPSALRLAVPGLKPELATSDLKAALTGAESSTFGASMSGQVVLSALATCQMGLYTSNAPPTSAVSPLLTANITYRYFAVTERKYRVTVNFSELYSRIRRASSDNGLFRSSSEVSVTNMFESDDAIKVEILSEDPRNAFPDTMQFIVDVKRSVLDRALQQVAKGYLPPEAFSGMPNLTPGTVAAPEMANRLRQCPNMYCQAGAIVLDLGHALFGGQDAVSRFVQENHVSSVEEVTDRRAVPLFGSFSFKPLQQ